MRNWWNRPAIAKLFDLLFFIISLATFRHTAAGFASIEGTSPSAGYLGAVAIDVTMYLSAVALNSNLSKWGRLAVGTALLTAALSSAAAQLLFSVTHAEALTIAPGALWFKQAQFIINWRVVWMPFSLPAFALLVSAAGKAQETTGVSVAEYRRLQSIVSESNKDLDVLDAQLAEAQAKAGKFDELQLWVDTLRRFNVTTGKGAAAMIAFAHNGHTPTQEVLAQALGVSKSTVRLGEKEAKVARVGLPGISDDVVMEKF